VRNLIEDRRSIKRSKISQQKSVRTAIHFYCGLRFRVVSGSLSRVKADKREILHIMPIPNVMQRSVNGHDRFEGSPNSEGRLWKGR